MSYHQNTDQCMADAIGPMGLDPADIDAHAPALNASRERLALAQADGSLPLLRLPARRDDIPEMRVIADAYRARFTDVVILGTGGSSLGGRALYSMADPARQDRGPRLHIVTNVDPFGFTRVMRGLNLENTGWIVISKSGGTAETLMQFLTVLPLLRRTVGDAGLARHVTLITQPGDSALRRLAAQFSLPVLDHDPNVGGRYSVLSSVGLLPTLIAGLDAEAVRKGAGETLERFFGAAHITADPPAQAAAIAVALNKKRSVSGSVMLAYSDRLGSLSRWYRQLWAESLGKDGEGTTPIYGTGPVDQHSQLQLWLDGPSDKMFTVLGGPTEPVGDALPPVESGVATLTGLDYLADRTMADLMECSRRATAETLARSGKPVRLIRFDAINEESMGAMMMHFMLETILAADLLGVDPFDQPAVEEGKVLTRRYLADLSDGPGHATGAASAALGSA